MTLADSTATARTDTTGGVARATWAIWDISTDISLGPCRWEVELRHFYFQAERLLQRCWSLYQQR